LVILYIWLEDTTLHKSMKIFLRKPVQLISHRFWYHHVVVMIITVTISAGRKYILYWSQYYNKVGRIKTGRVVNAPRAKKFFSHATFGIRAIGWLVPVLPQGNTRYIILVDVIRTLMCFDNWSSVSVRQKCNICECRSPTDCKDTWHRTTIGAIPTEGPTRTSWRSVASIALLADRNSVSRRSSSTQAILPTSISTRCGWPLLTQRFVLRVKVCQLSQQ
jgi:hypothetical protein